MLMNSQFIKIQRELNKNIRTIFEELSVNGIVYFDMFKKKIKNVALLILYFSDRSTLGIMKYTII